MTSAGACAGAKTSRPEFVNLLGMVDLFPPIDPTLDVDALMHRWPGTIRVFVRRRMLCPGCAFAKFHSIEDACQEHGLDLAALLSELAAAISGQAQDPAEATGAVPIP